MPINSSSTSAPAIQIRPLSGGQPNSSFRSNLAALATAVASGVQPSTQSNAVPYKFYDAILGGPKATVVIAVPPSYGQLEIAVSGRDDSAGVSVSYLLLRFNGDATAKYDSEVTSITGNAVALTSSEQLAATSARVGLVVNGGAVAGFAGHSHLLIENYGDTVFNKDVIWRANGKYGNATGNVQQYLGLGSWENTAAITQITLFSATGNLAINTRITGYAQL